MSQCQPSRAEGRTCRGHEAGENSKLRDRVRYEPLEGRPAPNRVETGCRGPASRLRRDISGSPRFLIWAGFVGALTSEKEFLFCFISVTLLWKFLDIDRGRNNSKTNFHVPVTELQQLLVHVLYIYTPPPSPFLP